MVLMFLYPFPFFWQNNQVLGIGSGSTIVHAVQLIGVFLGCLLHVLCGMMLGRWKMGRKWATGWAPVLLGSSSVPLQKGAAYLRWLRVPALLRGTFLGLFSHLWDCTGFSWRGGADIG